MGMIQLMVIMTLFIVWVDQKLGNDILVGAYMFPSLRKPRPVALPPLGIGQPTRNNLVPEVTIMSPILGTASPES